MVVLWEETGASFKTDMTSLTTPENTMTYHNALFLSPQDFAQTLFLLVPFNSHVKIRPSKNLSEPL